MQSFLFIDWEVVKRFLAFDFGTHEDREESGTKKKFVESYVKIIFGPEKQECGQKRA